MQVKIDKRVELLNVIRHLAESETKKQRPDEFVGFPPYVKEIHNHFDKFEDETAVTTLPLIGHIIGRFHGQAAYLMLQNFDEDYLFNPNIETGGNFKKFVEALPEFAQKSGFDDWFVSQQHFYDECIKEYVDFVEQSKFEEYMKWFYGKDFDENAKRSILLLPSVSGPNHSLTINDENVCVVSVDRTVNGKPCFVGPKAKSAGNAHTLWHEFSHPIVNPLVFQYVKNNGEINLENEVTRRAGTYSGTSIVCETIVEAIVALLMRQKGLNKEAAERIESRKQIGQYLIGPLCEKLEQDYIPNKEKYDGFSDYFPQVMEFLKCSAEQDKEVH